MNSGAASDSTEASTAYDVAVEGNTSNIMAANSYDGADSTVIVDATYIGPDGSVYMMDETLVVDQSTGQIEEVSYEEISVVPTAPVQYMGESTSQLTMDSTQFVSVATGPVPTDLNAFTSVDSSYDVNGAATVSGATTDINAYQAYAAQAEAGQENSLGLIDGTEYEEVTAAEF